MHFATKKEVKLPKRSSTSHKGQNGYVLAVGGSEQYPGAIILSSLSALRSGCDLVKVVAPSKTAWAINAYSPDIVTKKLSGKSFNESHITIVLDEMKKFDVLLIGNGIGLGKASISFCKKIISKIRKQKVIDADAIKSISFHDASNSIVTPHSKELEMLLRNSKISEKIISRISDEKNINKKAKLIQEISKKFLDKDNIILLKGKIDVIISKNKIVFNKTGNAGMTRGGTGDVLAGLCAGFLAQSKDLFQSSFNAAFVNGQIGDILLKKKKGFTYLASDMVNEIKKWD